MSIGSINSPEVFYILKEFQTHIDDSGNFELIDWDIIFNSLVEKGIFSLSEKPMFRQITTSLAYSVKLLYHQNGPKYKLLPEGNLAYLAGREKYGDKSDISSIKIDNKNEILKIKNPCKIFISCGERENEFEIGDRLFKRLNENEDVEVYWWKEKNPNPNKDASFYEEMEHQIKESDLIIGVLHKRERLENGKYTSSTSVQDEMRWAIQHKIHCLFFREEEVNIDGMILPHANVRKVKKTSEIFSHIKNHFEQVFPQVIRKTKYKITRNKSVTFEPFKIKDTRILRPFEYELLLEAAEKGRNGFDNKTRLNTLLYTGLAYEEARRFQKKREWYKPDKNIILLPKLEGKKQSERIVRLPLNFNKKIEGFFDAKLLPETLSGGWVKNLRRWGKKLDDPMGLNTKTTRYTWASWLIISVPDEAFEVKKSLGMREWSYDYKKFLKAVYNLKFTKQDKIDILTYVEGW